MSETNDSNQLKNATNEIIRRRMLYAAGLGLIPIPIVDAASILGSQILMTKEIAALHNIPFENHRVKSLIGTLVGSFGTAGVLKAIPGLGTLIGSAAMSLTGIAATYAIGKVFSQHFSQGGTLLDFDPVKSRKYFKELFEEGKFEAEQLKAEKKNVVSKWLGVDSSKAKTEGPKSTTQDQTQKKAEKRKILDAKRRKRTRKKWGRRLFYLLILAIIGTFIYYQKLYKPGVNAKVPEIVSYMERNPERSIEVFPAATLDAEGIATVASFSPSSTEGELARYIKNPESTYPKRYTFNTVKFSGESKALSTGAKEQLRNIAFIMKHYPGIILHLYVHTSNVGPEFNRQKLGRERARALLNDLSNLGIPNYRISAQSIEETPNGNKIWDTEVIVDISEISNTKVEVIEEVVEEVIDSTEIIEKEKEIVKPKKKRRKGKR